MAEKLLAGTNVLMVIAPLQFRDEELLEPRQIFLDAGCAVTVASPVKAQAKGMLGATFMPDVAIKDVQASDFQAVVVVGGMGAPEYLWDNFELARLIKEMASADKVVAAICLSGAVLARACVLEGKKATVWPSPEALSAFQKGQVQYQKQSLVQDGRFITADGPPAAREFGQCIVAELCRQKARV